MREVTNFHVNILRREVHFTTEPVLLDEKKPSKALLETLQRRLGDGLHHMVAQSARFNKWDTVTRYEIVLCKSSSTTKVAKIEHP